MESEHIEEGRKTDSGLGLEAFLGHAPKRKVQRSKSSPFDLAKKDAERRAKSGDWTDASGRSFVGLYAICHRMTYGVEAVDLEDQGAMMRAARAAKKCLHVHFGDDPDALVEFMKWSWDRERSREEWAAANGVQRKRMGIYLQFSNPLVVDYRVECERRKKRRGGR